MGLESSPWFWGLCGALIVSAGRLALRLWGDDPATGHRVLKAWADFVIAMISGPVFAEAFVPLLHHYVAELSGDTRAISLAVGLSVNSVQPMVVTWLRSMLGAGPK